MSLASVDAINAMPEEAAHAALLRCCGSYAWVEGMLTRRPYESYRSIVSAANQVWAKLNRSDWLEAFAAHPRIGDLDALRRKFTSTAEWCSAEQADVANAGDTVLRELAEANRLYEERFGYIFIVCASGKCAAEMLVILRSRLNNDPEIELKIAAAEQAKITRLRLEKL